MGFPLSIPAVLGGGSLATGPWDPAQCWAFIGQAGGVEIRWSTTPLEGFEPRLIDAPAAWSVGPSSSASGNPELPSTSLEIDNGDGALSRLFLGVPPGSADSVEEYQGDSLLDLRGALHLVTVDSAGEITTRQMSPPMVLSGPVVSSVGSLSISLAADANGALGAARSLRTLRDWLALPGAEVIEMGDNVAEIFEHHASPRAAWDALRGSESDQIVPWVYGGAPFKLTQVIEGDVCFFVGAVLDQVSPSAVDPTYDLFQVISIRDGKPTSPRWSAWGWSYRVRVDGRVLLCFAIPEAELEFYGVEGEMWCRPERSARLPTEILRRVLADHCPGGVSAFDAGTLADAGDGLAHLSGALAGLLETETTIGEVLEHVCPAIGLRSWIDVDGVLKFALRDPPRSEWKGRAPQFVLEAHDDLPLTTDGMPSWSETLPTDPDDVGSAASHVAIDWPQWATTVFPRQTAPRQTIPSEWVHPLAAELRISGQWIHPDAGDAVLDLAEDRAAWPVRTISFATNLDLADVPICSYGHVSSEWGHAVDGFGVEGRLVRLVRLDVRPGDFVVVATLEDMGAVDALVESKLDSRANWIAFTPPGNGPGLTMRTVASGGVHYGLIEGLGSYLVTPQADQTIWGPPSTYPGRVGEASYRLIGPGLGGWMVDPPPLPIGSAPVVVSDSDWRLMKTYVTGQDVSRPGYIGAASDTTGRLDGPGRSDPPFRFVRL